MNNMQKAFIETAVAAAILVLLFWWLIPSMPLWLVLGFYVVAVIAGYPAVVRQKAYEKFLEQDDTQKKKDV